MSQSSIREQEQIDTDDRPLHDLAIVLRRYRHFLLIGTIVGVLSILVLTLLFHLAAPEQRFTSVQFRLEFEGADRGEYPNRTQFNVAEIVATPVLNEVFNRNRIGQYTTFEDFSRAIFVLETNRAQEELAREYRNKLSDPRLTAVDRDRLEREYNLKREAINKSTLTISFAHSERTAKMPKTVVSKTLYDVLNVWSRKTVEEKGVTRYPVNVVSGDFLARTDYGSADAVIRLDVLRQKASILIDAVDDLMEIPGAPALRARQNGATLLDIVIQLQETIKFRVGPSLAKIQADGATSNPREAIQYFRTQLSYNEVRYRAAQARVDALRLALANYSDAGSRETGGTETAPTDSNSRSQGDTSNVTPQLSESFLDRIMAIAASEKDSVYRQAKVDEIRKAALAAIPLNAEAEYYRSSIPGMSALRTGPTDPSIEKQIAAARAEIDKAFKEFDEIYTLLSRNLNASSALYAVTSPVTTYSETGVPLKRRLIYALIASLLVLPILIMLAWLNFRLQRESERAPAHSPERV
jgi:hypothetical protein